MGTNTKRALGWKKDAPKPQGAKPDRSARARLGTAPPPFAASARQYILDVLDQLQLGSCVANGTAQALRAAMVKEGIANPPLASRLWIYYLARAIDHDTNNDDGTQIRNAFTAITRLGFPPESVWPYSDDTSSPNSPFRTMPPTEAFNKAYDQRANALTVYERLPDGDATRADDIKRAIAAGHCVVFGTTVSEAFCQGQLGSGPIGPPKNQPVAGGHCMVFAEYEGDVFRVVNSWSKDFGKDGWVEFDIDYVNWSETNDLWICSYAPTFPTPAVS